MNEKSLEDRLKEHHRKAYLWALHCCNYQEEESKDVLQTAYLKILERKAKFGDKSSFKTWLFSVIRFTAIDHLRKSIIHDDLSNARDIEYKDEDTFYRNYRTVIESLPDRQREVLLLSFYHQMTLEDISNVLEISIGSVRTHYHRGKQKVYEIIKKEEV